MSVALSGTGTAAAARTATALQRRDDEKAEEAAVGKERRLRIKRRRQVLMYIDVGVGGGQVGRIEVRRDSKPFSLAHQFVRQHQMDVSYTVKLSKLIEDRVKAFLDEENRRDQAERRRANRREVQEYRRRFTRPKPFQLRSDAIARSRGADSANLAPSVTGSVAIARTGAHLEPMRVPQRALVGRLHVQVGQGKTGTIVIRAGDDPVELVENFRKAFGLRRGVARHLAEAVRQRLVEHDEQSRYREQRGHPKFEHDMDPRSGQALLPSNEEREYRGYT